MLGRDMGSRRPGPQPHWVLAKDLRIASARLAASGLAARVGDNGPEAQPTRFTHHPGAGGLWVELVAPGFALTLERWFAETPTSTAV
jgi:hypothetical protein